MTGRLREICPSAHTGSPLQANTSLAPMSIVMKAT